MGEEAYIQQLNQLDIEVNPRYGTWDAANVTLGDPSLSRVATAKNA
jgi:hypothetical protein